MEEKKKRLEAEVLLFFFLLTRAGLVFVVVFVVVFVCIAFLGFFAFVPLDSCWC